MRNSLGRIFVVVVLGTLVGSQAARTTAVRAAKQASASTDFWPSHPEMQLQRVMAEMGARSAKGQSLTPEMLGEADNIARAMPLAAEPFLIKGALAQTAGRDAYAERLYIEARLRDPRSRAARYLLAERYLRSGRIADGLVEMAAFSNLAGGSGNLAAALASYARSPGAVVELKRLFHTRPYLEEPVLTELAGDAENVDLVLALRSPGPVSGSVAAPRWPGRLVGALIAHGEFDRAYRIWAMLSRQPAGSRGLFNPEFKRMAAPPPFNWAFGSAGGVAEPANDGWLEVIYFGSENAVLAEQILLLGPGTYTLSFELGGDGKNGAVAWTVDCLPSQGNVFLLPLKNGASGLVEARFSIPSQGCAAQRLRLSGKAGDFSSTTELTIGKLNLAKAGGT